jgi:hypothetical protein
MLETGSTTPSRDRRFRASLLSQGICIVDPPSRQNRKQSPTNSMSPPSQYPVRGQSPQSLLDRIGIQGDVNCTAASCGRTSNLSFRNPTDSEGLPLCGAAHRHFNASPRRARHCRSQVHDMRSARSRVPRGVAFCPGQPLTPMPSTPPAGRTSSTVIARLASRMWLDA